MFDFIRQFPRETKPRNSGLTLCLDNGLPNSLFRDFIDSYGVHIDSVKLGWGTSVVTPKLKDKIEVLKNANIEVYLGGSLFEVAWQEKKVPEFLSLCRDLGVQTVEVSDGTYDIPRAEKLKWIETASKDFKVYSEVGSKDSEKSQLMSPAKWIDQIESEMKAGSSFVITEAREGGTSGICRPDGELRFGLIEEILESSKIDSSRLIFEAPNKQLQVYFIKRMGPNVNLGNIAFGDVVSLETLRCALRSDTMSARIN